MKDWGLVIAAVTAAGLLLVVLPVVVTTFQRFRAQRSVACPDGGRVAGIQVDPLKVALGAAFDRLPLRVRSCTLWPEKSGCRQGCLRRVEEAELRPSRPAA